MQSETVTFDKTCVQCHGKTTFKLPADGYLRWKSGELVQNALPKLSADDRELLISGMCGECFDLIFAGDAEFEGAET